jgi:hypothetical protein
MALSLWQGAIKLGDVHTHGVVAPPGAGRCGCVLALLAFRADVHSPGAALELRNARGQRLRLFVASLTPGPGATVVAYFDGASRFDWVEGERFELSEMHYAWRP